MLLVRPFENSNFSILRFSKTVFQNSLKKDKQKKAKTILSKLKLSGQNPTLLKHKIWVKVVLYMEIEPAVHVDPFHRSTQNIEDQQCAGAGGGGRRNSKKLEDESSSETIDPSSPA